MIANIDLKLISYGLGDFKADLFKPIENRRHLKPKGGLWGSPVDSKWGWRDWCEAEDFGDCSEGFEYFYSGKTLVIDSENDLKDFIWQAIDCCRDCPDYEKMEKLSIDAIYVTQKGESDTRFTEPGLYGYDCESVIIMNRDCIKPIDNN